MSKNSTPPPSQAASTSKPAAADANVGNVEIIVVTPSTPLIKRCRPMTDEMILRAPSKERSARRSENFTTTSIFIPQTPKRRSDFQYHSKPLFVAVEGIHIEFFSRINQKNVRQSVAKCL